MNTISEINPFQLIAVVYLATLGIIYLVQEIIAAYWPNSWLDRKFE